MSRVTIDQANFLMVIAVALGRGDTESVDRFVGKLSGPSVDIARCMEALVARKKKEAFSEKTLKSAREILDRASVRYKKEAQVKKPIDSGYIDRTGYPKPESLRAAKEILGVCTSEDSRVVTHTTTPEMLARQLEVFLENSTQRRRTCPRK